MNTTKSPLKPAVLFAAAAALGVAACSEPAGDRILVPGRILLPESLTSTADGTVYIGSISEGSVYKAAPGATEAEPWIAGHTGGLLGVFGVLADESTGTLWICSSTLSFGPPQPGAPTGPSALHAFDLAAGTPKASYPLPGEGAFCNDAAVGPDGSVYATDTQNMRVVRLAPGATELVAWSPDGAFGEPGGVLDGIAVVGGGVLVNTLGTSKLFAVDVAADGSAGEVSEIVLSRPIAAPDGMRSYGEDGLLIVEGGSGQLSTIVLAGDEGAVATVGRGYNGAVAVTQVGTKAYVLEGQFAYMEAGPDEDIPPIAAIGVELGEP